MYMFPPMPTTPHSGSSFTVRMPAGLSAPLYSAAAGHSRVPAGPKPYAPAAANDGTYFSIAMDDKVRILRRADETDRARLVLSGRMADVCAALERLSRAEAISAVR